MSIYLASDTEKISGWWDNETVSVFSGVFTVFDLFDSYVHRLGFIREYHFTLIYDGNLPD
jgi:hypothetical protein